METNSRVNVEVLTIMFHAIISALIIMGYIALVALGHDNETMKFGVIGVLGYWFGFTSKSKSGSGTEKDKPK